jgi:hypothetical protein
MFNPMQRAFTRWRLSLIAVLLTVFVVPVGLAATSVKAQSTNDGLVGYWPFDIGSAEVDRSGSGNTVTFYNGSGLTNTTAPTRFANTTALLSSLSPTSYATTPATTSIPCNSSRSPSGCG